MYVVPAPGQPCVSVTSITATSISLSWSVPGGSVVTTSEVMWREASSGTTSGSLTDTSYTIDQLESNTIYTITVTVSNTAGSTDSQPVIISTSNYYGGMYWSLTHPLHIQTLIVVMTVARLSPLTVRVQRQTILQLSLVE